MFSMYQLLTIFSVATSLLSAFAASDFLQEKQLYDDMRIIKIVRKIVEDQRKENTSNGYPSSLFDRKDSK